MVPVKKWKKLAKKLYLEYLQETEDFDCGANSTAYIKPKSEKKFQLSVRLVRACKWAESKRYEKSKKELFLIMQIFVDPMENASDRALGYSMYAFTDDEEKAKKFCAKGKTFTEKDCWAIGVIEKNEKLPEFKYKKVLSLEDKIHGKS